MYNSNDIYHFGVKGMKWGVRRYQNKDGTLTNAGRNRYQKDIVKADKKRDKAIKKNWTKSYNSAADRINKEVIPALNKKYEKYDFSKRYTDKRINDAYKKYINEYVDSFNSIYLSEITSRFGTSASGKSDRPPMYITEDDRKELENS